MMFHNLWVGEGYVVIDMDYKCVRGYGRDWRNAIYQRMGPQVGRLSRWYRLAG